MSEQRAIVEMVSEAKPGAVFVPSDFAEAGIGRRRSQGAVPDGGSRGAGTSDAGALPQATTKRLLGQSGSRESDEIAEALARKFEWRIAPYGDTALNRLGVDSQVPSVVRYVSDGPYPDLSVRPLYDRVPGIQPIATCRG